MPINIKHVSWRDGRPRFQPSKTLREAGHTGKDLRHEDGRWFSRGEAVDWSDAFSKALEKAAKQAKGVTRPAPARTAKFYTVAQLGEDWRKSRKFQLPTDKGELRRQVAEKIVYAPKTVVDYKQKLRVVEEFDPTLWASPVDALSQPVLFGLYEELVARRGISTARGAIATLSIALGWGKRRGKFTFRENMGVNPAQDLQMATPPPRIRFGTRTEIETLVAVADHIGVPECGDMTMLGVWSGQRQGDRLALEDFGLIKGRRHFRQAKTGAIVAVLEAPELERRLAASAERRRAAKAEALLGADPDQRPAIERRFKRVILNEHFDKRYGKCFWRPFEGQHYSHVFARVRDIAVAGIRADNGVDWLIKPCKTLADFVEPDLRDTAVTWLALAGCTIPEICAITGHSLSSATRVLKHYLAVHPEMADAAIRKMVAWYEADGETEFGL
ncbi:hypothetical protein EFV37_21995 [Mesorhizobium loti]|uniref:Uncharacterized protein n=1 Tax=Mesorhizobium jarvisii TaxID=1777867 RepID=A0A6M7TIN0_9HYPH|nr:MULTISPECIES: hypothetical protein [Mesorhizobium]OBQ59604.1 hypothetical protein A9K72_25675 [Mesorhizobium loti]QKC64659.1 hypothetical protein EB229_21990 [Mesorhizobium jarvisii]QKD10573.1 hypothetical protein EFV37_21995 [Mesorhizobium loti]RJT30563.1 hypothetical protein D3242_24625 [Mesorhizobium jarvisii]